MSKARKRFRRYVAIALLSWPLLGGSCVDLLQRSFFNGFFNAVTPLLDAQLKALLSEERDA